MLKFLKYPIEILMYIIAGLWGSLNTFVYLMFGFKGILNPDTLQCIFIFLCFLSVYFLIAHELDHINYLEMTLTAIKYSFFALLIGIYASILFIIFIIALILIIHSKILHAI